MSSLLAVIITYVCLYISNRTTKVRIKGPINPEVAKPT